MPRRYFFAPISGGRGDMAQGIMSGAVGGLDRFHDERDRSRRREIEDERLGRERSRFDLDLFERGVRRGQAPTEQVDLRGRREFQPPQSVFGTGDEGDGIMLGMADLSRGPDVEGPGLGLQRGRGGDRVPHAGAREGAGVEEPLAGRGMNLFGPRPTFDRLPDETFQVERSLPGYQQINDDLYLDRSGTPAAERRRERVEDIHLQREFQEQDRDIARQRQEEELQEQTDEIFAALMQTIPGITEAEAEAEARMIARGLLGGVEAAERRRRGQVPVRGTDEYYDMLRREGQLANELRPPARTGSTGGGGGGGGAASRPTFGQARQYVEELYGLTDRLGRVEGHLLSIGERNRLIAALASGEISPADLPDPEELYRQYEEGRRQEMEAARGEQPERGPGIMNRLGSWLRGVGEERHDRSTNILRGLLGGGDEPEPDAEPGSVSDRRRDAMRGAQTGRSGVLPTLDPALIQGGREILRSMPGANRQEQLELLMEAGFTRTEAEQIIAGES